MATGTQSANTPNPDAAMPIAGYNRCFGYNRESRVQGSAPSRYRGTCIADVVTRVFATA
jgi:hypothetical protein